MNWKKEVLDRLCGLAGLVVLSPVMLVIALTILLTIGRPIFYKSKRVGRHGEVFEMAKFRSMVVGASEQQEGSVTVRGDRRVTPFGGFLRRFKLDELPELINVVKGDMSLVGPRPDVPGYADMLVGEDRRVLELKPGITGPATLKYANEEALLAQSDDPRKYNDEVIFPDKVRINLDYLNNWSLWSDIVIIFRTVFRKNYE